MSSNDIRVGGPYAPVDTKRDVTDVTLPFYLPVNTRTLLSWLDEQPFFVEFRHSTDVKRESAESSGYGNRITRTHTGLVHVTSEFERTERKSFSSQSDVAEAWSDRKFPAHNIVDTDEGYAAELYSLSSYQTDIEGPSMWPRFGRRQQQIPASVYRCSECGYTTREFDSDRSRQERKKRDEVDDHIESDHDGDARRLRKDGHRVTESEKNYVAYQFLDGSGRIDHYNRVAAVRSRYGVVLANQQDFAKGRASVTYPDEYDAKVPLSGLRDALASAEAPVDIYDVVAVDTTEVETTSRYGATYARNWYVVWFDDGSAFGIVYDQTAKNHHERRCGFYFPPEEAESLSDADRLPMSLRPVEVDQHLQQNPDADVIGSDEFTQATGRGPHGGYYTEENLGRDVIRQGEWYFVPLVEDLSEAIDVVDTQDHDDRFEVHRTDALPRECSTCESTAFEYRNDGVVECTSCESLWFVNATEFTEHQENPLGSHRPRECVVVDGSVFVRGMIRHDTQDHNAINLKEVWHLAVDNGRDGFVFDSSVPDNTSGRSGGGTMRVE